jgi:hypothetical protein
MLAPSRLNNSVVQPACTALASCLSNDLQAGTHKSWSCVVFHPTEHCKQLYVIDGTFQRGVGSITARSLKDVDASGEYVQHHQLQ